MSFSGSLFLLEFVVEEIKCWIDLKNVSIKCQLADIFTINLKNPLSKRIKARKNLKNEFRLKTRKELPTVVKSKEVDSIMIERDPDELVKNMLDYPLEVSFWTKTYPEQKLASVLFTQTEQLFYYFNEMKESNKCISIRQEENIFEDSTSKRIASIQLHIKISFLSERIPKQTKENNNLASCVKDPGTIKTIYSNKSETSKVLRNKKKRIVSRPCYAFNIDSKTPRRKVIPKKCDDIKNNEVHKIVNNLSKSVTNINPSRELVLLKSRSLINVKENKPVDLGKYIFGNVNNTSRKDKVYWVNYFSVQKNPDESTRPNSPSKNSDKGTPEITESCVSGPCKGRFKFKICDSECTSGKSIQGTCSRASCNEDNKVIKCPPIIITKCKDVRCEYKDHRQPLPPPDEAIYIDVNKTPCCEVQKTHEQLTGNINIKFGSEQAPCFCSCECKFGFTKKTTYCGVCGGFEKIGEDLTELRAIDLPHPCPIYHKLDKRSVVATTSDTKKKKSRPGSGNSETEKESKKSKKKKKDDRFKFNHGYKAPQIGHSQCAMPCTGTLGQVPKHMGWLWTADNVPGLKFRPLWKPGAVNKFVLRLLKIAKNPDEAFAKKKRRDTGKKKRPLKRPLLIVQKKDGEYTVTMETMKTFTKPRAVTQYPYEDKPLVTYTIGRTDEENRMRQKKKERVKRRLERAQRRFIQSTFTDMCKDICLKTYHQALGILPFAEDPPCLCYPAITDAEHTNLDVSCSCSEDKSMTDSDTDLDEWIVEFTPPNAYFDQSQGKVKKVMKVDNESQYNYLDYRVNLLDRYGNQVPRFFTGPDGKKQCSDLGGFWSPNHKWLEINVDGYIAPDGRWAPLGFIGPNGEQVDTDTGKFQAMNGDWLIVGIDGYIDNNGKWRSYPKSRSRSPSRKKTPTGKPVHRNRGAAGDKKDKKDKKGAKNVKPSETAFSCFGDTSPRYLSELGKMGHGHDRRILLAALRDLLAKGEDVIIPKPQTIPKFRKKRRGPETNKNEYLEDRRCHHPAPSSKGIIAVDKHGHKVYFRLKEGPNRRPKLRLEMLHGQGISLSSFHMPCLNSFINSEDMKKKQRERLELLAGKSAGTQFP